jgi:hypothetical protein
MRGEFFVEQVLFLGVILYAKRYFRPPADMDVTPAIS